MLKYKGRTIKATETGAGPVDAIYKSITKLTKVKIKLVDYVIQAITGGTDALGEVSVRIQKGNDIYSGHGSDTDIIIASANPNGLITSPEGHAGYSCAQIWVYGHQFEEGRDREAAMKAILGAVEKAVPGKR